MAVDHSDDMVSSLLQWMNSNSDKATTTLKQSFISTKIIVKHFGDEGRGLAATTAIVPSEEIIKIPHSYLLNPHSIIRHIAQHNKHLQLPDHYGNVDILSDASNHQDEFGDIYSHMQLPEMLSMTSFQLMSLYICLEKHRPSSFWSPFIQSLPTMESFSLTPLVWEVLKIDHYQQYLDLLPRQVRQHSLRVKARFDKDYKVISEFLHQKLQVLYPTKTTDEIHKLSTNYLTVPDCLWAWLCINSRCLYMELRESNDTSDNFTMAPFVDFVNHSDEDHCCLKIDSKGFHVNTTTKYNPGEQIFLSYGSHSNGFLLCEYGFILANNRWNDIDISHWIMKELNSDQIEFLKKFEYYDDYTIGKFSGVSYRTEIALAVLQERSPFNSRKLLAYVKGLTLGESYAVTSKTTLKNILQQVKHECNRSKQSSLGKPLDTKLMEMIDTLYRNMEEIIQITMESFINA